MKNKKKKILLAVLLIAVIVGIVSTGNHNLWQKKAWQAVFLNNNQVYFGKIQKINRNTLVLTNIYYLQAGETLSADEENTAKLKLVKLGSEVHGPQDRMIINRSSILFWEDLKNDAKIVKIINQLP